MASALSQAKTLAAYNNKLEQSNVKLQYTYNKSLADADRSFQERMANSAHQREIKDLKAAGLNPVLSVTGGNGSATPSGSSTSVSKPNVDMSLPRAVMDMAMSQLNSATALQTTAMNNANALEVARQQGINQLSAIGAQAVVDAVIKGIPSGDSYYGQYNAAKSNLKSKIHEKFPRLVSAKKNFDKLFPYNIFADNGASFRGVPLVTVSPYTTKEFLKSNKGRKSYTDIDSLISNIGSEKSKVDPAVKRYKRRQARKEKTEKRAARRQAKTDAFLKRLFNR